MRIPLIYHSRCIASVVLGLSAVLSANTVSAAQANCDHIWKDTTNIVSFPASIAVPYGASNGAIFQTAVWQAPAASGLNDGNKPILICSTPGDIVFRFKADATDPNERNAALYPYFLNTSSAAVNVKFTYGKGTAHETIMSIPQSKGSFAITLPNAIPSTNEKGEPLDGSASLPLRDGARNTYTVTLNKLRAITPMTITAELQKNADAGSSVSIGGFNRVSWFLEYDGATLTGPWSGPWSTRLGYFQLNPLQVTTSPCYPPVLPSQVDLGNLPLKNFPSNGTRYSSIPVPFQVSLTCPGMGSTGGVYFGFQPDITYPGQTDLLAGQTSQDSAAGVAVELLKADGVTRQPLLRANDLTTNWVKSDISASKKTTTLQLYARVRQMENIVQPGSITARATLLINFK
ncbi:fimbrial protein [uncultured Aquitalea sp.]|uniref:fimbrial protein n=1 Tax=uncultured Aquitalea sp. TaxID=540272 RepID=UPI0025D84F55|nr:fimbrial protein [uncultured Aquitalea sp.]